MAQVEFEYSGQEALRRLPTDVQDTVLSTLDSLDSGDEDRQKVLKNDRGGKYHYFTFEKLGKDYIVVVNLRRRYGGREDKLVIVDMGETSDFLIDS